MEWGWRAPSPRAPSCPSLLAAPLSSPNPSPKKDAQRRQRKRPLPNNKSSNNGIKLTFTEIFNFPTKVYIKSFLLASQFCCFPSGLNFYLGLHGDTIGAKKLAFADFQGKVISPSPWTLVLCNWKRAIGQSFHLTGVPRGSINDSVKCCLSPLLLLQLTK